MIEKDKLKKYEICGPSAITFGKFDGLHEGHMLLVEKVSSLAKKEGLQSVVCAFDMYDFWKKKGMKPQVLMTKEERVKHLKGLVDHGVMFPFDWEFSQMEPEDFVKDIVVGLFHAKYVVVGPDFSFGKNKGGDTKLLEELSKVYGFKLLIIEKKRYQNHIISSTYIRESLQKGDIRLVNTLLGYPFEISGVVIHGRQLGRTLGFPTVNVMWPEYKIVPPRGVYMADVYLDGKKYHSVSNIGVKPTVTNERQVSIEAFLFDYSGNAYDKEVRIELLEYKRPEQKFQSVELMKKQVDQDIIYAKKFFSLQV